MQPTRFIAVTASISEKTKIRVNVDMITSYSKRGKEATLLSTIDARVSVLETPEEIDQMLALSNGLDSLNMDPGSKGAG